MTKRIKVKANARKRLHQNVNEIAVAEHEVMLERFEVVHEHELVKEDLKQPLAGDIVRRVDRRLKASNVTVLEN